MTCTSSGLPYGWSVSTTSGHVTITISAESYTDSWAWLDETADLGPVCGWWTAFYPRHAALTPKRESPQRPRPVRPQARHCHKQAARWKRRRFVQSLRSA